MADASKNGAPVAAASNASAQPLAAEKAVPVPEAIEEDDEFEDFAEGKSIIR